jgi:hypothetical protein
MTSVRGRFDGEIVVRGGINCVLHAPFWEVGREHHYVAASDGTVFRVERCPEWRFVCVVAGSGKWHVSTRSCEDSQLNDDEVTCFSPLAWIVVTSELAGDLPPSEMTHSCHRRRSKA